jgi:hypothetical protein
LRQIWAAEPSILRDHSRIFVPGRLVQLGMFGVMFVGFGPSVAKFAPASSTSNGHPGEPFGPFWSGGSRVTSSSCLRIGTRFLRRESV